MSDEEKTCCGGHHHHEGEDHHCCGGHHHQGEEDRCCCGHNHEGGAESPMAHDVPLPPPTLTTLASQIATQAMVSMGVFPNPGTGKSEFYFHQASHLIDTIDLLIKKTEGNRTEDETRTLTGVLSELQMLFVAAQNEKSRRDSEAAKS
ncbi:MAG: DUF1844 domain-containing protein [Thermoguttaceae bacterium]|nr:DUF1844 domain-containing protein [Thermoguttaceae bacterium]